ncbi:MAG TPA: hypothetical protein VL326_04970 [Kofleriaceae bacterium]|nr:hypothetical protein [Kofleriaceae bacterium]
MKAVLVALVLVATAARAYAEDPWAKGVSAEHQKQANALFAEANQLFAQQAHPAALEKYKAAIALWDHPLIRFNMAVTLIRLDRLLEASDALDAALRFGEAPFPKELYQQALDYQKLIQGRVGVIEASCDQAGVSMVLDGRPWLTCPGTKHERVTAGEHRLVAEGNKLIAVSRRVIVAGNATTSEKLHLMPIDLDVRFEYPVSRWVPWAIAGTGAALAGGGLALYFNAKNQLDEFRSQYATQCMNGCQSDLSDVPELRKDRDSALRKGTIAVSAMIGGSAIAVGGIIWGGFINRPHRVAPKLEVAPTSGGAAASASWRF